MCQTLGVLEEAGPQKDTRIVARNTKTLNTVFKYNTVCTVKVHIKFY